MFRTLARATRISAVCLCLLISLALAPEARAGQASPTTPETGSLTGLVLETDGTPVSGVFVVLEGPVPEDTQRRARSDGGARFRFEDLVPGTYRLAVQLPGLAAPGDVEVTVTGGETVEANAILSLFAYDVSVEVVARMPEDRELIDREAPGFQIEFDSPLVTQLPLRAEQVLEALPLMPGVVRGPSGLVSIGGSLPADSAFLFNGADLIDPYSGVYRMQVPLEAVDRVELSRGANAATYGDNIGGVVDVSTAGAGDEWFTELGSLIPRPWFRDGSLKGIRRFNPRLRFGGPLVPGRLYFSQSLEYHIDRDRVRDVPGDRGDHILEEGWESLTQVDWRPIDSRHRISLMLLAFPDTLGNAGLDGLTPVEATSDIDRAATALLAEHRVRLSSRSALTTTVQLNRVALDSRPALFGRAGLDILPEIFEGRAFHREDRSTRHWQLRSIYSRNFGEGESRHALQLGIDLHGLSTSGSVDGDPIEIRGADGRLIERTLFAGDGRLRGSKREVSAFIQNRYRPGTRAWFDAGIRFQHDTATGAMRVAPRVGFAWDMFGDTRTLLKGSSGLLYRRIFLGEFLWSQQLTRLVTELSEDGESATTRVLVPSVTEEGPRRPRAWVGSVELSHRLSDAWTLSARYTRREVHERMVFDLLPGASVTHDPDADPAAVAATIPAEERGRLLLASVGESSHEAAELTASWRDASGNQLFFSYVRSRAEGDLNDFGRVVSERPDPVLRPNAYASLPFDARDRLILWGRLYLPWELIVAPMIEWRSGFPWSAVTEDQSYLGAPNSERFPAYVRADITITKGWRIAGRQVRFGLQFRNLTNHFNPRNVIPNVASDRFGEFLNDEGFRIKFRSSARF